MALGAADSLCSPGVTRSPTGFPAGDHFAGGLVRALLLQYALQGAVASQMLTAPRGSVSVFRLPVPVHQGVVLFSLFLLRPEPILSSLV